jgi:hypothetical protein
VSALTSLVRAGGLALEPLERALADPEACMRLLRELGVDVSLSPAAHGEIAELMPIAEDLRALPDLVAALDGGGPAAVLALADRSAEIGAAIAALDGIDADDLTALPGLLSLPETWTALAAALPSHLLARQLALQSPALFAVLRLTGVCVSEGPGERPRYRLDWSALGPALADPTGAVRAAVGWGDRFSAWPLQRELALLLARYGLQVDHRPMQPAVAEAVAGAPVELPSGAESDVVLFSGTTDAGAVCELGLVLACARDGGGTVYVGNLAYGAAELAVPLGETWSLEAAGALDGLATIGVRLRPSGVALVGGDPALAASLALVGRPADPWVLLGSPDGTRLQLDGARVEVGVDGTVAEPDPYLLVAVEDGAFRLVIDLGVADSFLRGLIGGSIPEISAGGELRWGAGSGVAFGGGGLGLEVTLPIDKAAGPLHVDALTVALGGGTDSARMAATTDASLTFGPFTGMVGGIGAAVDLLPGADGVGGLRAEVAFVPPTRIGLEVDAEGVVTGGGFVDFDAASGRYAGALSLDFPADVGLDAIVVVDTRLPGDPDGWALFASLFATFPSIPLGFGFFLSGVGGLVCLNRTMDGEAIAAGLKSGAVDAILFPDDVLGEAGAIVAQLDAWFPLAEGNTVFGVAATITWGTPKVLVTGELGVMVSFPDLEIAVLGSVAMVLPEEADAVLELHMDSIGVIDVADQTVTVAASLYDSALLHTLHLSGDMALYARLGVSPYFLLSIGGYNPHFKPPAGLPPSIVDVRRMRAEVALGEDAWFALEAYVAVTSNTLQFGALAALEASSTFLATRYTARGEVGFDVLLVFSPFKFVADFHASVSVTAGDGDKELIAVSLAAHLEGPEPWYVTGRASFDFFGIDVKFELDVGGAAGAELPGRENVLSLVAAALREATAWRGVLPAGADAAAVALTEPPEVEGDVWARPDAELEAAQSIAPLGRALDRYGLYAIDGPARIDVTEVSLGGDAAADWEAVRGWFAPAQYDDMSRTEKLSAPSYEEMDAGVRFGTGAVSFAEAEATSVVPDYEVHVLDERKTRDKGALKATRPLQVAAASLVLEPGLRRGARQVTSTPAFTVAAPAWAPVDAVTGRAAGASGTYRDALAAVHADGAGLRVAPSHAIVGFHK